MDGDNPRAGPLSAALAAFPAAPSFPEMPKLISAHDFLAMEIPHRELLLSPWLPEKGLTMIAAPRGVGKTFLALNIAYAVASGGRYLKWQAPKPRSVLYVDGEMPAAPMQERLAQIAKGADAEPPLDYLKFALSDLSEFGLPDLSTPEGQAEIGPAVKPFDLIIFDNLSTLCRSGKENEAESWALVQAFALEMRRAGKSALFIHHAGKNGSQRGTSKREDVLDSVLLLKRPDDYDAGQGARFIVQYDKSRGFTGADAAPFEAALDPQTGLWSVKPVTNARDAEIWDLRSAGMSQHKIAKEVGVGVATVNRVLKKPPLRLVGDDE